MFEKLKFGLTHLFKSVSTTAIIVRTPPESEAERFVKIIFVQNVSAKNIRAKMSAPEIRNAVVNKLNEMSEIVAENPAYKPFVVYYGMKELKKAYEQTRDEALSSSLKKGEVKCNLREDWPDLPYALTTNGLLLLFQDLIRMTTELSDKLNKGTTLIARSRPCPVETTNPNNLPIRFREPTRN